MDKLIIKEECIDTLCDVKYLKLYDLKYREGKHYFDATRRAKADIVAIKSDEEFRRMLPDAVTIGVVVRLKDEEPKLLLQYEYRYPTGQFLLSPVAGLIDPEDKEEYEKAVKADAKAENSGLEAAFDNALFSAAKREIHEETGIEMKATDSICVLNPCAFSSPGMTDESNAFLFAEVALDNLDCLNQNGAVGSELFNGFELVNKEEARKLYRSGRDKYGNFYSLATWAVLAYFISL
ncbi:MAG: NUDIX hydrolase [Lachnospiraceae bacterium]|nr:NUDIX hydrolase [Lachnospiraceae bacterium]